MRSGCTEFNTPPGIGYSAWGFSHFCRKWKLRWPSTLLTGYGKSKAVPQHIYEGGGERSYSSYSLTSLDGVSGQRHAAAVLYSREKIPGTHWTGGWVGPRVGLDTEEKYSCLCRGSNLDRPVVQSVTRHYSDWATHGSQQDTITSSNFLCGLCLSKATG
jgi:hypothetical protein